MKTLTLYMVCQQCGAVVRWEGAYYPQLKSLQRTIEEYIEQVFIHNCDDEGTFGILQIKGGKTSK